MALDVICGLNSALTIHFKEEIVLQITERTSPNTSHITVIWGQDFIMAHEMLDSCHQLNYIDV